MGPLEKEDAKREGFKTAGLRGKRKKKSR